MPPPQLTRDVPVPNFGEPVLVDLAPAIRHEGELAVAVGVECGLRERSHLHEPLIREPRLDHGVTPVAVAHRVPVRVHLHQQSRRLQQVEDALSRLVTVQTAQCFRHPWVVSHAGVVGHDGRCAVVAGERGRDVEVVGIVGRRHLEHARAELPLDGGALLDRDGHLGQRNLDGRSAQPGKAVVVGVIHQAHVAEHRLGPGRGDDRPVAIARSHERIPDVVQVIVTLPELRLFVGK